MSGLKFAGLSPHPPLLVPEIGGRRLKEIQDTQLAMQSFAKQVAQVEPDLVITISPHGPVFSDAISILNISQLKGDFAQFGFPDLELSYDLAEDVIEDIVRFAKEEEITVARIDKASTNKFNVSSKLDHGVLVPLYYLREAGVKEVPLLPLTMGMLPYTELYKFGKILQLLSEQWDYRIALIASGDLSHRLTADAPAGFSPQGKEFDQKIVEILKEDKVAEIFDLEQSLIEKAGECGLRPIVMMLGALDGLAVDNKFLAYEGPFGVGYAVASYRITGRDESRELLDQLLAGQNLQLRQQRATESVLVKLARKTVEEYALNKEIIEAPESLTPEMEKEAGVFVSIKKNGQLRGCIGTTEATEENVAQEIIRNALNAAFKDPRFPKVDANELAELTYSVDVLGEAEKVEDIEELDPQKYGVIIKKGSKRGLLLPRLDGVDSVEKQLEIAKRKAGLAPQEEDIEIMRFEVKRYQ
ncbi:AmmeMemoRadiSam system protein A [Fuchsiella alkaliacetigena]|uniref:AmmeMemoRadiSam system protein A n=1 Tax=Fuchsiella alkaliacetigena TaxID=957042 RepID=UPI00200B7CB9|nr:AmmeMemoRadiSam system protein A [Fuchsiella alkaliacetigena]MCK8824382.1 AmmeMemoRadiSam system protein A [Fuchsiella alkaliacetigena]